jgi:DNA-binding IclR family transcriptional regulator
MQASIRISFHCATSKKPAVTEARSSIRSVERAIDVLLTLGAGSSRLADVSAGIGLSRPTTYRLLSTLKLKGMVLQDFATGEYRLGPSCFRLTSSIMNGNVGFPRDATVALESLRDATSETVTIHVMAGTSRICVQELASPHAIRFIAGLGATAPIYSGSAGKVLLAFLLEGEREASLRALRLMPITANTITDPVALRTELAKVRAEGTATSVGERVAGAVGISAPVFDSAGRIFAAVSVLGPAARLDGPVRERARELVQVCARAISTSFADAAG